MRRCPRTTREHKTDFGHSQDPAVFCCTRTQHPNPSSLLQGFPRTTREHNTDFGHSQRPARFVKRFGDLICDKALPHFGPCSVVFVRAKFSVKALTVKQLKNSIDRCSGPDAVPNLYVRLSPSPRGSEQSAAALGPQSEPAAAVKTLLDSNVKSDASLDMRSAVSELQSADVSSPPPVTLPPPPPSVCCQTSRAASTSNGVKLEDSGKTVPFYWDAPWHAAAVACLKPVRREEDAERSPPRVKKKATVKKETAQ